MQYLKKNNEGFSLIELMVVVAIIGILSAVAVPQFQKFQRKARQAEAKSLLSAAYTAQKVFLAETGTYYTNLYSIGFEPEGLLKYLVQTNYSVSTITPVAPFDVLGYHPQWHNNTYSICRSTFAEGLSTNCMQLPAADGGIFVGNFTTHYATFIVTQSTFKIGAGSKLGGSETVDVWTMDHRKEFLNVRNGAL